MHCVGWLARALRKSDHMSCSAHLVPFWNVQIAALEPDMVFFAASSTSPIARHLPPARKLFRMPESSLSRRSVLTTAAWSAPVIAVTAATPSFAASQCLPTTLDWNSSAVGSRPTTVTIPGATPALTATFAVTYASGTPTAASGTVVAGPQGAVAGNYYRVEFATPAANVSSTVTITFNRPVQGVNFTILDIDATASYRDQIEVLTPGFVATPAARVIGAGTAANPFQMNTPYANIAPTAADGNLQLAWAGPLGSVSFRYFNANVTGSQNMVVGISNIGVNPC